MELVVTGEPWMQDALCAETDPEAFFPEKGGSTRDGKRICGSCDVAAECLEYALRTEQVAGIWGGRSAKERQRLRRERIAGGRVPLHGWADAEDELLRQMVAERASNTRIATALGRTKASIAKRREVLGLPASQYTPIGGAA